MIHRNASRWRLEIGSEVEKELEANPRLCQPFVKAVIKLSKNPYQGPGIRKLRGCKGLWRIKVSGRLRLVYAIDKEHHVVHLLRLGHRDRLYSKLERS